MPADHQYTLPRTSITIGGAAAHLYEIDVGLAGGFRQMSALVSPRAGQPVFDWLNAFIEGHPTRQSGVVRHAGDDGTVQAELEFRDALLTEISFPAFGAGPEGPRVMRITWRPEETIRRDGDGRAIDDVELADRDRGPSTFSVTLRNLSTRRIRTVAPIIFSMEVGEDGAGPHRLVPGRQPRTQLLVTIDRSDAQQWHTHHQTHQPHGGDWSTRGSIEWQVPGLARSTLELDRVALSSVSPVSAASGTASAILWIESARLVVRPARSPSGAR